MTNTAGAGRGAPGEQPGRQPLPVDQPLALISQAQRSGGTLLLRLFDGHSECHVVPFQLRQIDQVARRLSTDPAEVWELMHDPKLAARYESGHRQAKRDVLRDDEVFPFQLPPRLHRELFDVCSRGTGRPRPRDLVDCYFTSYFNAWRDYGNLGSGPKRWVVGFEPGITRLKGVRRGFDALYPDGRVISVVRDPWSWYASARRWEPQWREREPALAHWCDSARGMLRWKKRARDRFLVLSFDDLLTRTEETMRRLASWLGIPFAPELLVPTFNGRPIRANTSFADVATEVSAKPLARAQEELDEDDIAFVTAAAGQLYERLLKLVEDDRTAHPRPASR
jgi:Sulfotransferase family